MQKKELENLIGVFGKAYFKADRDGLAKCTTPDFDWHQHSGNNSPTGQIIKGVDSVCREVMGKQVARNFDRELRKTLLPYSKKKRITFKVITDLRWGFP
jgi:hypothetical protein